MTLPDDDLRSAFQHWRTQESQATPPFPGRSPARSLRRQPGSLPGLPWVLAWSAAALVMLLLSISLPRRHSPTLAEALPRPLLAPAEAHSKFLADFPGPDGDFSDFLRPTGSRPFLF